MTKDWVHGDGHSPVCQILLQIVRAMIASSPPAWTSSAGMLSTPPTSLSSMIVLQPPLLCEGWGFILCVCLGTVQYWWISIGLVIVQLRAVFSPSVQYDLQHDFAWVTDGAYCSVVLALQQVAFLGKRDD